MSITCRHLPKPDQKTTWCLFLSIFLLYSTIDTKDLKIEVGQWSTLPHLLIRPWSKDISNKLAKIKVLSIFDDFNEMSPPKGSLYLASQIIPHAVPCFSLTNDDERARLAIPSIPAPAQSMKSLPPRTIRAFFSCCRSQRLLPLQDSGLCTSSHSKASSSRTPNHHLRGRPLR
jgi:hypothetical protein